MKKLVVLFLVSFFPTHIFGFWSGREIGKSAVVISYSPPMAVVSNAYCFNRNEYNKIWGAAVSSDFDTVRELLEAYKERGLTVNFETDFSGSILLNRVPGNKVKKLFSLGADVNSAMSSEYGKYVHNSTFYLRVERIVNNASSYENDEKWRDPVSMEMTTYKDEILALKEYVERGFLETNLKEVFSILRYKFRDNVHFINKMQKDILRK